MIRHKPNTSVDIGIPGSPTGTIALSYRQKNTVSSLNFIQNSFKYLNIVATYLPSVWLTPTILLCIRNLTLKRLVYFKAIF